MHNRNRLMGGFEEAIERGQSTIKNSTKNAISDTASAAKNQITGGVSSTQIPKSDQGTNEAAAAMQTQDDNSQMTDEERVKFLRDLYGSDASKGDSKKENKVAEKKAEKGTGDVKVALGVPQKELSPEESAKLEAARRQLHGDYYREFIEKSKSKEPSAKEKIEQEEKEKKMDELQVQKNDRKKQALNPAIVKQGTAEAAVGTVG